MATRSVQAQSRGLATARRSRAAHSFARGLGWFSIGLGLAELFAPRALARATGLSGRENVLRAYGLREIATGVGILASKDPTPWVWARAGGDALDMATLGTRVYGRNPLLGNTDAALAAVAGVAALDVACARALGQEGRRRQASVADYRNRSGLPRPPAEMRGAALDSFRAPADMQAPAALKPYDEQTGGTAGR